MIARIFLDHPHCVGETYREHRAFALGVAFELLAAGAACAVHALVPALFERTASGTIRRLHRRLEVARGADEAKFTCPAPGRAPA